MASYNLQLDSPSHNKEIIQQVVQEVQQIPPVQWELALLSLTVTDVTVLLSDGPDEGTFMPVASTLLGPSSTASSSLSSNDDMSIARSLMTSTTRLMRTSDIYKFIERHYKSVTEKSKAWKNTIRNALSANKCFLKCGPTPKGQRRFWTIHHACIGNFLRGIYRSEDVAQARKL